MLESALIKMLAEGTRDTLYMTLVSSLFGYLIGLPVGILLTISDKDVIKPNRVLYRVIDIVVNIM